MIAEEWLDTAKGYLRSADELSKSPNPYPPSVWHLAWQASENALKALAVGHSIPYEHDLNKVMKHLEANSVLELKIYGELLESVQAVTMSGTSVNLRFPQENPVFYKNLPLSELTSRVDAARRIVVIAENELR